MRRAEATAAARAAANRPPQKRFDHTGETVANRTVTGFAGRDHVGKPLWAWRCNNCGHVGEPSRWENLAQLEREKIQNCNECKISRVVFVPIGTRRNNLEVVGKCRKKADRQVNGSTRREIHCRCVLCGNDDWWSKANFLNGAANCKCEQHCQQGRSNTYVGTLWSHARARARRDNLPFTITHDDIVIPETCPVLGIPIQPNTGKGKPSDSSPSVDQIIPGKGYTPENSWVVSYKANRIKSDATLDELQALVESLSQVIDHRELA